MFQVVTAWNFVSLEKDFESAVDSIRLRGYSTDAFITGGFLTKITNEEIKPLSVSDIADIICPSRRDLYLRKGKSRPRIKSPRTWGGVAGRVVENFMFTVYDEFSDLRNSFSYSTIKNRSNVLSRNFRQNNLDSFEHLDKLRSRLDEEPDWLLKLLTYNCRAELGLRLLHRVLSKEDTHCMRVKDLKIISNELKPHPKQVGISSPAQPDFMVEKYKVVGDIKSGIGGFKDHYLLTCAGYALAYENERGKNNNMDFGIVYFFPTRYTEHAKPISFGHVYIFPIDDGLRDWFLRMRNQAYAIVSKDSPPDFPTEKYHCARCRYYDVCRSQGLVL